MSRWDGYWRYYPPARPRKVKDGIKAKSQRGRIGETWWSKRWIGVLESFNMGARLTRGRTYARRGQVVSIDVGKGVVTAKVQGTRRSPYAVNIQLKPLSDKDWDKVADAMTSKALFVAKLLAGEMPQNIEEAFAQAKVSLFPQKRRELITSCSCPDWANPCKHVAAVYYLLAERFDEDPFLIFKLRGRTKEEITKTLREKRTELQPEAAAGSEGKSPPRGEFVPSFSGSPEEFWLAGKTLDSFVVDPVPPEVENPILKRLGKAPFSIGNKNLNILLAKAYTITEKAALKKAFEEASGRGAKS